MRKIKFYILPVIIITFGILAGFTMTNCGNVNFSGIKGNGKIVKDERKVNDFSGIEASGAFNIVLNEGENNLIKVEADENIVKHIITKVEDNILKLYTDTSINNTKKLNIFITYKNLNSIDCDGACNITGNSEIKTELFSLNNSGTSDMKLNLTVTALNSVLSGAGNIKISGRADIQNIELSGVSSYDAFSLVTNTTSIDLSGAGSAKINAVKEIKGEISGVGSIYYKGEPLVKNVTISGLGSISKN